MNDAYLIPTVISVGVGLTVIFALAAVSAMRSPMQTARGRIGALGETSSPYSEGSSSVLRQSGGWRSGPLLRYLDGSANEQTQHMLDRSGLPLRVGEYLALRIASIFGGALLFVLIFGALSGGSRLMVGALLGLVIGFVLPSLVVRVMTQRRSAAIETQLIELCDLMASMLRSGYGYTQALASTAAELEDPLSSELLRLVDSVRLGGDVDEALKSLNERLGSRDFDMIATAISIQRQSGGNLSEILDGVGETIRDRQSFRFELRALTSRERFSAVIVAGLPLVLVAILVTMDPDRYRLLFTDTRGQAILGVAMAMNLVGYVVIKRVSKVEV